MEQIITESMELWEKYQSAALKMDAFMRPWSAARRFERDFLSALRTKTPSLRQLIDHRGRIALTLATQAEHADSNKTFVSRQQPAAQTVVWFMVTAVTALSAAAFYAGWHQ